MTKSWPTFSSRVIREMRERSFLSPGVPALAVVPMARAAVTPAVAARTVRLEGTCAPSGVIRWRSAEGNFREGLNIREVSASQGSAHGRGLRKGAAIGAVGGG